MKIENIEEAARAVAERDNLLKFIGRIADGGDGFELSVLGNSDINGIRSGIRHDDAGITLPWGHIHTAVTHRLEEVEARLRELGVELDPDFSEVEPPLRPPAPAGTDDEIPF